MKMRMSIPILMIVVLGLSASIVGANNYTTPTSPGKGMVLEGASEVLMPHVSIVAPEGILTYPYNYYPVYAQNQTISGNLFGPDLLAGSEVGVAAIRVNTSSFQEALGGLFNVSASNKLELLGFSDLSFNRTGGKTNFTRANFTLVGMPPGLFALVAIDMSKLAVRMALPMLVANGRISVESAENVSAGDVLKVNIKVLSGQKNISREYGAALASWTDYVGARINMKSNGSKSGMTSTISIGNESLEIQGEPKVSRKLVEKLLPIQPQDSALAFEESNRTESEINLLTDVVWKPGRYVLTCGVYSSKGLDGISQKIIDMT
jgi:methanogen extracellular protein (TIGR04279 family)